MWVQAERLLSMHPRSRWITKLTKPIFANPCLWSGYEKRRKFEPATQAIQYCNSLACNHIDCSFLFTFAVDFAQPLGGRFFPERSCTWCYQPPMLPKGLLPGLLSLPVIFKTKIQNTNQLNEYYGKADNNVSVGQIKCLRDQRSKCPSILANPNKLSHRYTAVVVLTPGYTRW